METCTMLAEILPQIEEAYKLSVCGHTSVWNDGGHPSMHARIRWTKAFEVWLPVPNALVNDSTEDLETTCRKLSAIKLITSARVLTDPSTFPAFVSEMGMQDTVLFHVICVPFKDLAIC